MNCPRCNGFVEVKRSVELSVDEYKIVYEAKCLICGWREDERVRRNKEAIASGTPIAGMMSHRGRDKVKRTPRKDGSNRRFGIPAPIVLKVEHGV